MSWKDLFKDYPKDMTKYAMMGMLETLKVMLTIHKVVSKERFEEILFGCIRDLGRDLDEIREEE